MQPAFTPDQVKFISSWLRRDSVFLALATVFAAAGLSAIDLFLFRRSGRALALLYFGLIAVPYGVRLAAGTGVVSVASGTVAPWPWVIAV